MSYVIETGFAIPSIERKGRPPSEERLAMLALSVGQSFLIEEADRVHHARCIAGRLGERKFTVLKTREGWRVWRTE